MGDWLKLSDAVDDEATNRLEGQAYSWAGLALVPRIQLAVTVRGEIERARLKGFCVEESPDLAAQYISHVLAKRFAVSSEVVRRRIALDHLI